MNEGKVGYGRPPVQTQFKKGQSGNSKGRPKHTKNLRTDLEEELHETIRVHEGDREYRISKQRAVLKALVARALKGDMKAATAIIALCARVFGVEEQQSTEALAAPDQRVLDEYVEREIARRKKPQAKKGRTS